MRRRYHVRAPGVLYLLLVLAVGFVAANRPGNLLVWVFAAMLSGVLLSGILSGWPLMRLRVRRRVPATGVAGEPLVLRYEVSQGSRAWSAFAVSVRELRVGPHDAVPAPAFVRHVGPRETVVAESVAWPARRGALRFGPFRAETAFPFGLIGKSVRFDDEAECLVLPRARALRPGVLRELAGEGRTGAASRPRTGPGSDFLGLREYRPGDSIRSVAWRRSSAGGGLAVIERSMDAPPRVGVVLDLRRPTGALRVEGGASRARELEEDAIVLAASLLQAAASEGMETSLAVLGLPGPAAGARAGRRQLERELCALAALDLDAPRDASATAAELGARTSVIVVHVDRADLSVGGPASVHLVAGQLRAMSADFGDGAR
jgi:uncharacterized protein (DUF58 family)